MLAAGQRPPAVPAAKCGRRPAVGQATCQLRSPSHLSVNAKFRTVNARLQAPRCRTRAAVVVLATGQPLRVMIAGAPAAGKGTQCAKIVEKFGLVHISVGDLLRAEVAAGTPAGKKAKSFMDNGDLVPNEVVVEMVKNKLGEDAVQQNGWLLDGYPRSGEQAEAIEKEGIRPDVFLLINARLLQAVNGCQGLAASRVPDELLIDRVVGRRSDPETGEIYHLTFKPPPPEIVHRLVQRSDDTEEKAVNRLRTYHANVDAVVGYYKEQLVEIDGTLSMDEVFASIQKAIGNAKRIGAQC